MQESTAKPGLLFLVKIISKVLNTCDEDFPVKLEPFEWFVLNLFLSLLGVKILPDNDVESTMRGINFDKLNDLFDFDDADIDYQTFLLTVKLDEIFEHSIDEVSDLAVDLDLTVDPMEIDDPFDDPMDLE